MWHVKLKKRIWSDEAIEISKPPIVVSAVLIPVGFNPETNRDEILMTKRTHTVFTHKGQVGFPGGLWEEFDKDLLETAFREAFEEVGLKREDVELLGRLSPVSTQQNNILIYPWVGRVEFPYPFVLSTHEVDRLIYFPVEKLLTEGLKEIEVNIQGMKIPSIGTTIDGELIWGASARILYELRNHLLEE